MTTQPKGKQTVKPNQIKVGDIVAIVAGPYPENVGCRLEVRKLGRLRVEATPVDKQSTLYAELGPAEGYRYVGPGEIAVVPRDDVVRLK